MIEDYINPKDIFQSLKDEGFKEDDKGRIKAIMSLLDWPQFFPQEHLAIHTGMPVKSILELGMPIIDAMPLNWEAMLVSDVEPDRFCCNGHYFSTSETEIYIVAEKDHLFVGFLININQD